MKKLMARLEALEEIQGKIQKKQPNKVDKKNTLAKGMSVKNMKEK